MAEELKDVKYLKKSPITGVYSLKKSHQYFFQVMGCLGLSGEGWSEFFVQGKKEFHYERIYYDAKFLQICLKNSIYFISVITCLHQ